MSARPPASPLACLHPALARWFERTYGPPSAVQARAWPLLARGDNALLIAPTGTGKTLAVMAPLLGRLAERRAAAPAGVGLLYLSPLRALSNDLVKNLQAPVTALNEALAAAHGAAGGRAAKAPQLRLDLRTGDTLAAARARMRTKPPDVLVTTPESLAILLATGFREHLAAVQAVVVDELHSLAENKRGVDCALTLRRLEHWCAVHGQPMPQVVGLSATLRPPAVAAGLLAGPRPVEVVEVPPADPPRLAIHTPLADHPYPRAGYSARWLVDDLLTIVAAHRTTLVFANTRSSTEWLTFLLRERLAQGPRPAEPAAEPGPDGPVPPLTPASIVAHHSALDRGARLASEDQLKAGQARAVICSSSLELGIDIGAVDCVVMISTPKGVGRCLQRVGRSGHAVGRQPSGVFLATNINDLVECAVTARLARAGAVEDLQPVRLPLDVLAQHLVGFACSGPWALDEVFAVVRRCPPFADLDRPTFDRVVQFLVQGGRCLERYPEFRRVAVSDGMIGPLDTPRGLTVRTYTLNVGTIVSDAAVALMLGNRRLGTVEESFLSRLDAGEAFVFGGQAYELVSRRGLSAKVRRLRTRRPVIPRWNAARMPLSTGIAAGVAALRDRLAGGPADAAAWLQRDYGLSAANAAAVVRMHALQAALSVVPRADEVLVEAFAERRQLSYFFHTLAGRRANELLARVAALRLHRAVGGNALTSLDDYGFMLRVRPDQELGESLIADLLAAEGFDTLAGEVLAQSPLVRKIFRETAQTGLLVQKNFVGQSKSPRQMHYSADIIYDVLAEHEPDHPMLAETRRSVLEQEMDVARARAFVGALADRRLVVRAVRAVPPLAFGLYVSGFSETITLESREVLFDRAFADLAEDAAAAATF